MTVKGSYLKEILKFAMAAILSLFKAMDAEALSHKWRWLLGTGPPLLLFFI